MADWLEKAKQIGPGYTRWELAYNRRLDCKRGERGAFQCQAVGMPSTAEY